MPATTIRCPSKSTRFFGFVVAITAAFFLLTAQSIYACTGITLKAKDGAVIFGRTMEWGSFDLKSRIVIVPRGFAFQSTIADGKNGRAWTTKYGAVGLDAVEKDFIVDGMNEKGLAVNVFYHPGFAEYPKFDSAKGAQSVSCLDLAGYLLTTCASVAEARKALADTVVVGIVEPAIGIVPPVHLMITEPSGKAVVVEFTKGEAKIHDAPLGVITNAPNYDWHETNLRNYLNLSAFALPDKKIEDLKFSPLGGGSGMLGVPGDFTPPSRFVRATAFSKTARSLPNGEEAFYELFRILDNFNLPIGAAEGEGHVATEGLRSSTAWTTGYDTKNLVMQYHTAHNRRVRQLDLKKLDFSTAKTVTHIPLDKARKQDIEEVTP